MSAGAPTDELPPLSVADVADNAVIGPMHLQVLAICFITAIIDGLDTQIVGLTAVPISKSLNIPLPNFGFIFAVGFVGMAVGAVIVGRVADWIGRRPALMLSTVIFGVMTGATPLIHTSLELALLRFVAGVGLGGAMPSFLTLVSEYAPKSHKAFAAGLLWCGYPVGGALGGLVAAQVLDHYHWGILFYLGGILALGVAALQFFLLPESMQFLAGRGNQDERVRGIARRLAPHQSFENVRLIATHQDSARPSLKEVFADGRAMPTVLLWLPMFMTFFTTKFLVSWSPVLFSQSGMTLSTAALMVAILNFAAIPSAASTGYLVDRWGPWKILPVTYACLGIAIVAVGIFMPAALPVAIGMAFLGFIQGPAVTGCVYLATAIYPSHIRSTGTGLALGIGRSGQVLNSLVIGAVLSLGASGSQLFFAMAIPPLVALGAIVMLGIQLKRQAS